MNTIRRAITTNRHRLLKLPPFSTTQHHHASTYTTTKQRSLKTTKKTSPELQQSTIKTTTTPVWEKPSEIPWQAKVVNSVNLIGQVKIPVQFEASPDGKNWAGTIISQDDASLHSFWIPVIFEGDLAHIAMCHLKEKDYVHVAGHLSVDVPPLKLSEVQANVQVMAHNINFVQDSKSSKVLTDREPERWSTKTSVQEDNVFTQPPLKEPDTMSIQPHTLFEKSTINGTESFPVHNSKEVGRKPTDKRKMLANWRDLLSNSKQWLDNRENKRKGLVKANYPDFKHKHTESGDGLWLNRAPPEILQGLGRLQFCAHPASGGYVQKVASPPTPTTPLQTSSVPSSPHEKDGDSWKHLVENPSSWWDNRVDKKNPNGPDFKHKDSRKGLWLVDAPAWAVSSLPPLP
uniref:Protein OSB2, chloroplastic-like n=1 Tax=Tanacetum cinerariifolium TaxID=118510 RepID=A0A6L2LPV2_TANCI|nr:protein OSB2, chloroplastic-like [Tanacetum cinerariifolium]